MARRYWFGFLVQGALGALVNHRAAPVRLGTAASRAHAYRATPPLMGGFDAFPYTGTVRPGVQTPRREIPTSIVRPDYAGDGRPKARGPMLPWQIEVKNAQDIAGMRVAGRIAREVLDAAGRRP